MVPPSLMYDLSVPGSRRTYLPPSRPSLAMEATVSTGSLISRVIVILTRAS